MFNKKEIIEYINNNKNCDFNVFEEVMTSCGYKGLCIVSKKPNVNNAYQVSADLILNEVISEVAVLDFVRCKVYTHYRDYGFGIGKVIRFEQEDFERYARKDPKAIGQGVHIRIETLAIQEDELKKISEMNEIEDVINFLQNLYPMSKPKPIIDGEPTDYELLEKINYEDKDFKIREFINWDNIVDGYLIEGKLTGNIPIRLEELINGDNEIIEAVIFVKDKENKGYIKSKNDERFVGFDLPGYINQPKLDIDDSYVVIKLSLSLEDLQEIYQMNNFEEVFNFLESKSLMLNG
ncbi:hypothetical protein AAEO50_07395 [Rossellomorea oryzaecorticis]|uniref:Uncharacterized protein n=1 Tax=Rossellomorea oryzaecorticis TaxID=1396505 RepID=A0ABU9K7N3_9BACI